MARFIDAAPGFIKDTSRHGIAKLPQIPASDILPDRKDVEYDYQQEIKDLLKGAQAQAADQATELALGEIDLGEDLKVLATRDEIRDLLSKAKNFLDHKDFKHALAALIELLMLEPAHHEAIYLKGLCQAHLTKHMEALRSLAPLAQVNLEAGVRSRVAVLRSRIHGALIVEILASCIRDAKRQRSVRLAAQLEELVELAPEIAIYHYLLSVNLLNRGRMHEALKVVIQGQEQARTPDVVRLAALQSYIEQLELKDLLRPAVGLYKEGRYRDALARLKGINGYYQDNALLKVFSAYLKKLDPGFLRRWKSVQVELAPPAGKSQQVLELYNLLVRDEIDQACACIGKGRLDEAEGVLTQARGYTPAFPFVNFLLGWCIYNRLGKEFSSGSKDITSVLSELAQARGYAQIAADGAAGKQASALIRNIDQALAIVRGIQEAIEKREQEVKTANAWIAEFKGIMDLAKPGIRGISHFQEIHKRLSDLNQRLGSLKGFQHEDVKKALGQLAQTVKANFKQLDKMAHDLETQARETEAIKRLSEEFKKIMEAGKGGISSESQAKELALRLKSLDQNIDKARRQIKSDDGRKALAQLQDAAQKNRQQLERMQDSLRGKGQIANHFKQYQAMMQLMNSKDFKITSREQLDGLIQFCKELRKNAQNDRRKVDRESRAALDQLIGAIDNVISQLEGI